MKENKNVFGIDTAEESMAQTLQHCFQIDVTSSLCFAFGNMYFIALPKYFQANQSIKISISNIFCLSVKGFYLVHHVLIYRLLSYTFL